MCAKGFIFLAERTSPGEPHCVVALGPTVGATPDSALTHPPSRSHLLCVRADGVDVSEHRPVNQNVNPYVPCAGRDIA